MSNQKPLVCEVCFSPNYRIVKPTIAKRLMIKKYCKKCRAQTLHKEGK